MSRSKQDQAELAADAATSSPTSTASTTGTARPPTPRAAITLISPDPRRAVPHHRLLDGQRRRRGPGPQGLHRQARRDPRPGRYPDRETGELTHPRALSTDSAVSDGFLGHNLGEHERPAGQHSHEGMRGRRAHRAPATIPSIDSTCAQGVSRHDNTIGGPAARVALRGRLGRRAVRPPAPRAVHRPARCRRRGRLRRPGGAARADGAGRLPAAPGRQHHAEDAFQAVFLVLARKARSIRDPDLLGNWLYGVALRTARKASGQLARRRKNEEGDAMRSVRARRPVEPTVRRPTSRCSTASRPRPSTARSTACPGLPPAGRALLLRGPHPRRGGPPAPLPGRHAPQPTGPGAREAPPRPDSPRRRPARGRPGRRPGAPVRLGVRLIPSCAISTTRAAIHFAARHAAARGRSRPRRGPGPGGPAFHAAPQAASSSR